MKFLIAFAAVLAVSAAVYVAPGVHHAIPAYSPYVASPAYYGAHHLYKRGIYAAPVAEYHGHFSHAATPYTFGAHHLYKRGVYTAPLAYTGFAHPAYTTPYTGVYGAHHLYKRGIVAPVAYSHGAYVAPHVHGHSAFIAHTAQNTPFVPRYFY